MTRAVLLIAIVSQLLAGCVGAARREVRSLVDEEHARYSNYSSHLEDPTVDAYLLAVAGTVLESARQLNGADSPTYKANPTLDIYDRFEVIVVQDASPNAFVVGDDFACITTSLLLLADDPNQVAFVLAHEFGHLVGQDAVDTVVRRKKTEFGAALAAGLSAFSAGVNRANNPNYTQAQYDHDMQIAALVGQSILASFRPYRKEDEYEADARAVDILIQAGIPVSGAATLLTKLEDVNGDHPTDSHPPVSKRIARIEGQLALHPDYQPTRTLDMAGLRELQRIVRSKTLAKVDSDTLILFSVERTKDFGPAGPTVLQACGPLDAPADRVLKLYADLLMQHP